MSHECDSFYFGFIVFQCRTNDRASYVLSYGQPLAYNYIIVKKLNSLKHLVRTTVAESHN